MCVLSVSRWSNCLEPSFRSEHSSPAINYLCCVARLLAQHCPLLLTSLVVRLGKRGEMKTWISQSLPTLDSSLVSSHDYDTVSCLSTSLDSLIMAEHKLPTSNGKSSSTDHSCAKRWRSMSEEELVYLAFRVRDATNFTVTTPSSRKLRYVSSPFTCGGCDCQTLDP